MRHPLAAAVQLATEPRTRYYWSVTVRTNAESRHPVFCKTLSCNDVVAARLYICGLGLYEAALNGEKIGDEYLTPYCNNYNSWLQYQTYDITAALQKGGDLQVTLGNGWYKGRFGYERNEKPY